MSCYKLRSYSYLEEKESVFLMSQPHNMMQSVSAVSAVRYDWMFFFPPCRSDSAADKIRWVYFLIVPVEVVACILCWWAYAPWPALLSPHLPWPHPPLMWHRFTPLSTNQGVWIRFTFGEASSEYSCKPWNAIVIFYWTNNIRHKQGF